MMRDVSARAALIGGMAVFLVVTPARAEERDWVSYREFLQMTLLDKFYEAPASQRDKIRMRGVIEPVDKAVKPADMVFVIVHANGKERIEVSADGTFDLVFNPAWLKENAMVRTNIPKGTKARMGSAAYAIPPEGTKFSYVTLMAPAKQGNDLVEAQAGLLRVFAPAFNGVELHFAKPARQSMQILAKAGTRTLSADAKGSLALKLDEALFKENPDIVLSERPLEVALTTD